VAVYFGRRLSGWVIIKMGLEKHGSLDPQTTATGSKNDLVYPV
jgi:hypothetical protein